METSKQTEEWFKQADYDLGVFLLEGIGSDIPEQHAEYLEMLNEKELIRQENGLFITTNKGKVFQEMAKELKL